MDSKILFPETVMLIDAAQLNIIASDFKKNFERILKRPLQDMDVAQFVINLALDARLPAEGNEVQVIFVYNGTSAKLNHCVPSELSSELNGVAFRDSLGEFIFSSISPEEMATREELYADLLQIVSESGDVKRIIAVPFEGDNQETICTSLNEIEDKEVTLFSMKEPEKEKKFGWQMLAYPVMQAMGIKGEEIQ